MLRARRSEASHNAVRYGSCDASLCPDEASLWCLVCGTALTDSRAGSWQWERLNSRNVHGSAGILPAVLEFKKNKEPAGRRRY